MKISIRKYSTLSDETLELLVTLEKKIFAMPLSAEDFRNELSGRKGLILLIAFDGDQPCGYKVGYAYSTDVFFSLSGGVSPDYRRKGIAGGLLARQHREARDAGYGYVRTHTKNKYREMLILNIKSGFDVTGVYKSLKEKHQGIILEKKL